MKNKLDEILETFSNNPSPYIFIGSGFSKRYINTPDWENLLKIIADKYNLPLNEYIYESRDELFEKKINYPLVGSKLKDGLIKFKMKEDINFDHRKKDILKKEIVHLLKDEHLSIKNLDKKLFLEIETFKKLLEKTTGIITTNYDLLLEELSNPLDFESYIGQSGIINKNLSFSREIYKIHGCVTDIESLIVTKEDYEEFLKRQKYILGKLIVIFTEYPIIFLGYSLEDNNIINMLKDLAISLNKKELDKVSKKWLFINYKKDEKNLKHSKYVIRLSEFGNLSFNCIETDNYEKLFASLSKIKTKIPADMKTIKYIRKLIYEYELNPDSKISLCPDETFEHLIESFKKGNEVVVDFGIKKIEIYERLDFFKLTKDLIFDSFNYRLKNSKNFQNAFLRDMGQGKYFPRYKFFSKEVIEDMNLDLSLEKINWGSLITSKITNEYKTSIKINQQLQYWAKEIKDNKISGPRIDELESFVKKNIEDIEDYNGLKKYFGGYITNFKKIVTILDILKYKKENNKGGNSY